MQNLDASPHANLLVPQLRFEIFRYSGRTKWDPIHSKPKGSRRQSPISVTPQEVTLYIVCLATPRAGTPLVSLVPSSMHNRSNYSSQYRGFMTQKWISRASRRQAQAQSSLITVCSDSSSSGSGLSTKSELLAPCSA